MKKIISTFYLLVFLGQICWTQVIPYGPDTNTVLLDHFDGSTNASILAYSWDNSECGFYKPSATPIYSYVAGPWGLNKSLCLRAPAGQPMRSATYLQYPGGQILSHPNGTLEFWVYLTSYGAPYNLVDQGPYYGQCGGWTFGLYVDSTGQVGARIWNWGYCNLTSGAVKVPLNTWTHLATTWGYTGAKLYINGVLVGSDANAFCPADGYQGSVLITLCTPAGAAGMIDELRISNVQRTTFNVSGSSAPCPSITTFTPISGPVGTTVTITGANFDTTPANNFVFFGAVKASVSSATSTSLTVSVPNGAAYKPISITVGGFTGCSSLPFMVTFPTVAMITQGSFAPKFDLPTGVYPVDVAIGDIDGDGKPDLAVINSSSYASNTISVYRNTSTSGSITFAPKVDFPTGAIPVGIAIEDIDGNGKLDLIVANQIGGTVTVMENESSPDSIRFAPRIDFATRSFSSSIAAADIDGNGKLDLVIDNGGAHPDLDVLRNTSWVDLITSASFDPKVTFAIGAYPMKVTTGDIDGDAKPDLVTITSGNNVSVLRNIGSVGSVSSGSFATKVDFATGERPYNIVIGDLDGDGKPDMVIVDQDSSAVSVLRNTSLPGSVTFAPRVDFSTGWQPWGIAIGDIDGDGKVDLAVTNCSDATVSLLRNTSSPGFISFAARVDLTTGMAPISAAIGDLDGDGKPDLVTVNANANTVSIFRNTTRQCLPLVGCWDKVSGPADPIRYDFLTDSTVVVVQNQTVHDTCSYTTFPLVSSVLRGIDLAQDGLVGWRGVYQMSSDSLVLQIEGYWHTGLPVVATPTSFSTPTSYGRVSTEVRENEHSVPESFLLLHNFPNPYNPSTTIRYGLPNRSRVRLQIYNVLGQVVADLVNSEQQAGWNDVVWNANVASGLYFYRIEAVSTSDPSKRFVDVKKMILLK